MRHAAAFAGSPLNLRPSPGRQRGHRAAGRLHPLARLRPPDGGLRPRGDAGQVPRARPGLGDATIHYAVKANPAPEVVAAVAALGGHFDAASRGEIDLCLSLGVAAEPHRLRQHHQARERHRPRPCDGRRAVRRRRRGGALQDRRARAGRAGDLRMLVEASPGRLAARRKFGCSRREALRLMDLGRWLGLDVAGISFHAGSQMREPAMWATALDAAPVLWTEAAEAGHDLRSSTSAVAFRPSTASRCRRPRLRRRGDAHGAHRFGLRNGGAR